MSDLKTLEAKANMLDYLLGDRSNVHPMFGGVPNIRDMCFTTFMRGRSDKNTEDGGPCDWFNDTVPLVEKGIDIIKKEIEIENGKV